MEYISQIPKFVRWKIFSYLEIEDVCKLSQVNKNFHTILNENSFWKTLCKEHFNYEEEGDDYKQIFIHFFSTPFFPVENEIATIEVEPNRVLKKSGSKKKTNLPLQKNKKIMKKIG